MSDSSDTHRARNDQGGPDTLSRRAPRHASIVQSVLDAHLVSGAVRDIAPAVKDASHISGQPMNDENEAPQGDATRQYFLSIGRSRFLSLRSLRGLLPLAKFPTTIR
jgi:hypothetical protein